jgi:hypothetical protein
MGGICGKGSAVEASKTAPEEKSGEPPKTAKAEAPTLVPVAHTLEPGVAAATRGDGEVKTATPVQFADLYTIVAAGPNVKYQDDSTPKLWASYVFLDFQGAEVGEAFSAWWRDSFIRESGPPAGCRARKLLAGKDDKAKLFLYQEWDDEASAKSGTTDFAALVLDKEIPDEESGPATWRSKLAKADAELEIQLWQMRLLSDRLGEPEVDENGQETGEKKKSGYACTITYTFRELQQCHDWYKNFAQGDDGHVETAESPGCHVCHLMLLDQARGELTTTFYEEWDAQKSQFAYAGRRVNAGFMEKWFDFAPPFKWPRLVNDAADFRMWEPLADG